MLNNESKLRLAYAIAMGVLHTDECVGDDCIDAAIGIIHDLTKPENEDNEAFDLGAAILADPDCYMEKDAAPEVEYDQEQYPLEVPLDPVQTTTTSIPTVEELDQYIRGEKRLAEYANRMRDAVYNSNS